MKRIGWIVLSAVVYFSCNQQQQVNDNGNLRKALPDSTDVLNASVELMLNDYYAAKIGFVEQNDSLIIKAARQLMAKADSLPVNLLQGDSLLVNNVIVLKESFSAELKGLVEEKDREEMKRDFNSVTEQLLDFLKAIRYKRTAVWYFYCEQTFNNAGAGWLDSSHKIINPYSSSSQPLCGIVKDSL